MEHNWISHTVNTNGLTLHYYRTGENGRSQHKQPLICLHGITDNGLCWTRFGEHMAPAFDVILLDARGHGRSDAPSAGYTPADHATDVAGLIEALALQKPILIGHSMGAMTIAQFLATYPQAAHCAILEDPPWVLSEVAPLVVAGLNGWKDQLAKDQTRPIEAFLEEGRSQNPTWDEAEIQPWAASKKQVNLDAFAVISEASLQAWPQLVPHFEVPVLLITAEVSQGAVIQPDIASKAAALSPNLTISHIPKAGHSIRREQLEAYVEAVKAFIAQAS